MRSTSLAPVALLAFAWTAAAPASSAQSAPGPTCGPGAAPEQDRYVAQGLGRADLQSVLEGWERRQGLVLTPEVRRAVLAEYLCEEYQQVHIRPNAREVDVRTVGQQVLQTYLAGLTEDRPQVNTLSGLFGRSFGDAAWRFPKPRRYMLLAVVTRPAQAQVEVDGLALGAPKKALVLPGRHHLTALCPGYQTSQQDLEVPSDKNPVVQLDLRPSRP